MEGVLNEKQIEYVLYHLNMHFEVTQEIRDRIQFIPAGHHTELKSDSIVFRLSPEPFIKDKVRLAGKVPLLFPIENLAEPYVWEEGSLIFQHDLLKSAFILLSGYQESITSQRDSLNRFKYEGSIQQQLCIEHLPLVNYYFNLIEEGVKVFCDRTSISFQRNRLFENVGFMLSHDVDVIDTYNFNDLVYRVKKVLGLVPRKRSLQEDIRFLWQYLLIYLRIFNRPNPHWDFEYLVNVAKKHRFKSVFYFLHRDVKHHDSYYSFGEKRIQDLFTFLVKAGCEIGLHGSTRSANNLTVLCDHLKKLELNSGVKVKGVRQHRLIHIYPDTPLLHQECGFIYDSSLGFAEHEGFRNSFCMPFKLYDFEKDKMMDVWEIPLIVMDATLYMYRNMNPESSMESVRQLVDECKKFGGLFTLLWHNGNFDPENYPGGKLLFEEILQLMDSEKCISVTGEDCIEQYILPIYKLSNTKMEK